MDDIHTWLYDHCCEPILYRMWEAPETYGLGRALAQEALLLRGRETPSLPGMGEEYRVLPCLFGKAKRQGGGTVPRVRSILSPRQGLPIDRKKRMETRSPAARDALPRLPAKTAPAPDNPPALISPAACAGWPGP